MPTNSISDTISYISNDNESNQRIIIDIPNYGNPNWIPNTWKVSKIERANVRGRTKITLAQNIFDSHRDYIEKDSEGNIIGLWADYYTSPIEPTNPTDPSEPTPAPSSNTVKIIASTSTIKIGGSYKTLSVSIVDKNGVDITDNYSDADVRWTCSIDGVGYTGNLDVITWLKGNVFNKQKIKFCNDRSYLQKILEVKCTVAKGEEVIESTMQFELII